MNFSKENIIWLASYPKSGNTWIRIFLQVIMGKTSSEEGIPGLNDIPIASNRSLIDNFVGVNSSDLSDDEIKSIRPAVYNELSMSTDEFKLLKVHDSFGRTKEGRLLFPPEVTKAVIYIIRNPLDVAVSYAFHSNISFDQSINRLNNKDFTISENDFSLKAQVNQHIGSWSDHVNSWTTQISLPVYKIRYEDLINNSREEFQNLLQYLNFTCDDELFEKALIMSDFETLQKQEKDFGFREKPIHAPAFFREGKKDVYSKYLNVDQILRIIEANREIMNKFGYPTTLE